MILEGFKLGLMLQVAVGPVCIYIFQAAVSHGIVSGLAGVAGVTLVDSLYILAAILGIGGVLDRSEKAKSWIRAAGGLVLIIFGMSSISGALGGPVHGGSGVAGGPVDVFTKVVILTLTNPLTLVFWLGIFSVKLGGREKGMRGMFLFGGGAVLATLVFLTGVAVSGGYMGGFLDTEVIKVLNILVGGVLIIFGGRGILRRGV